MPKLAGRSRVLSIGPLVLSQISRFDYLISRKKTTSLRLSRWRPVCPECGYSLRGLTQPRCPECGVDLPANVRSFRRWAIRRIPWDRLQRGSLMWSYVGTVALLILTPPKAARRLAIPDRWGRAMRWAGLHILLAALAGATVGSQWQYVRWLAYHLRPQPLAWLFLYSPENAPAQRVAWWAIQSVAFWMIGMLGAVAVACAISAGLPGWHRAAKLAGVKWSLYVSPAFLLALVGWYGFHLLFDPGTRSIRSLPPQPPHWLLVAPYAASWALGTAGIPYARVRGWRAAAAFGAAYGAVWLLLTRALFPVGLLEAVR